jgi:hypothetical protein
MVIKIACIFFNPRNILFLGLLFPFCIYGQIPKENTIDTLKIVKKALNSPSLQIYLGGNTALMRREVTEGYICKFKSNPRLGYNFGFQYGIPLKKERSLSIGLGLINQSFHLWFSRETLDYEYFSKVEDYAALHLPYLEFNAMFNKHYILKKNLYFAKLSFGVNYGLLLVKNNISGAAFIGINQNLKIQSMDLQTEFKSQLPSLKFEIALGKVKKDLNLISLALVTNIAFTNNITSTMTVMPDTKYQAIAKYRYNGSYVGLRLCYTLTKRI